MITVGSVGVSAAVRGTAGHREYYNIAIGRSETTRTKTTSTTTIKYENTKRFD
jgi:hypothetical protein